METTPIDHEAQRDTAESLAGAQSIENFVNPRQSDYYEQGEVFVPPLQPATDDLSQPEQIPA